MDCGGGDGPADLGAKDATEPGTDATTPEDATVGNDGGAEAQPAEVPQDLDIGDTRLDGGPDTSADASAGSTDAAGPCIVTVTPGPGEVVTDRGAVAGKLDGDTWVFLGIPYAAPPVGPLRWRPPQPHECWDGVRDATAWTPACMQVETKTGMAEGSEDCLVVNVWVPGSAAPDKSLPVMFFVHGGGEHPGVERRDDGVGNAHR